jgi:alanine racemase
LSANEIRDNGLRRAETPLDRRTGGGSHRVMAIADQDTPAEPEASQPDAPPCTPDMGSCVRIDLAAIAANWRILDRKATPVECGAVVKADAYGCGLEPVTKVLATAGCRTFFVADLSEAAQVRALVPESVIYVLNGLLPGTSNAYADIYARPVIGSLVELAEWDTFCAARDWTGGAALHVDTGMNRLGINPQEAAALGARVTQSERHGITLLMSHLACADVPEHPLNDRQIRLFREVRTYFRGVPSSLANSSGIYLDDSTHCDLVRCRSAASRAAKRSATARRGRPRASPGSPWSPPVMPTAMRAPTAQSTAMPAPRCWWRASAAP